MKKYYHKNIKYDEVDTLHASGIPESASDKLYNSIVRIELNENNKCQYGTGFFMKVNIKGNKYNFLCTNFHVIKKEFVESKKELNIFYGKKYDETQKKITLDINQRFIKCFDKPIDVTIIEIIDNDDIPENKFLFPDLNYKNGFNTYLNENFFLAGYPSSESFKKERHISSGKIIEINNFEFNHTLDT